MSDDKYGRIFTEEDVKRIVGLTLEEAADILPTAQVTMTQTVDDIMSLVWSDAVKLTFPADEPIFLLRAQDKRALAAVRYYRDHQSPRAPVKHEQNVDHAMQKFERFRVQHPDRLKEPD